MAITQIKDARHHEYHTNLCKFNLVRVSNRAQNNYEILRATVLQYITKKKAIENTNVI